MNPKITREHLRRTAVVYVRQSSVAQVLEHAESRRRQYALSDTATSMGFAGVEVIDEDLGGSGSGLVERPGFQRLVAAVCGGGIGAVFCIEASRLARNGRDWHHLIDLCALVGTLVIDPDGVYEPRLINDRLLLGLKGTMSEYELSLLHQRSQAARDAKAKRGELRFGLPPGYCWDDLGRIALDPDERVGDMVRLIFRQFRELGSVRQVLLWALTAKVEVPVMRRGLRGAHVEWRRPAYHNVLLVIRNPIYAGAYVFGRTENRTRVVEGRARKTSGHRRPRERWSVLLPDHHPGYITWEEFEHNQGLLTENAHRGIVKSCGSRPRALQSRPLLAGAEPPGSRPLSSQLLQNGAILTRCAAGRVRPDSGQPGPIVPTTRDDGRCRLGATCVPWRPPHDDSPEVPRSESADALDCIRSQSNAHARRRSAIMEGSGSFEVVSRESGIAVGVRLRRRSALVELYGTVQ